MIANWSKLVGWNHIYWPSVYSKVRHMQCQIRVAYKGNDLNAVKQLQHNLTSSWAARALAVRIVTTNKGKNTGGIDYEIWDTPHPKNCLRDLRGLESWTWKTRLFFNIYI